MSDKKNETKKEKTPEDYVLDIQEACSHLGWHIGMKDGTKGISGLIVGSFKYLTKTIEQLEDGDEYDIWSKPTGEKKQLH